MTDIPALIARVGALIGPDREVDGDIDRACGCHVDVGAMSGPWTQYANGYRETERYTASVDAAIALVERVLPGWTIACIGQDDGGKWNAELRRGHPTRYSASALAGAPLPALALILAALKALQAQEADRG